MATTIVTKSGSGAPTASDLVAGELAVDLTNKRLYTENSGGTVLELGTNPSGDITFGDNGKAIFGAGSDLQIYHNGSHSIISDTGTGNLKLGGTGLELMNGALSEYYLAAIENAGVYLYHNGSVKLATTATGIDVTGSVTADGLTVEGSSAGGTYITSSSGSAAGDVKIEHIINSGRNLNTINSESGSGSAVALALATGSVERMRIDSSGNVGIGTPSPNNRIDAVEAQGTVANVLANGTYVAKFTGNTTYTTGASQGILIGGVDGSLRGVSLVAEAQSALNDHDFIIAVSGASATPTERMRIDSAGNVGIGTDSPNTLMEIASTSPVLRITNTTDSAWSAGDDIGRLSFYSTDISAVGPHETAFILNESDFGSGVTQLSGALSFGTAAYNTAATERMRIDSSGNVGIGASSPSSTFRTSINGDGSSIVGGIEFRNAASGGSTFTIGHASATSPSATLNVVDAANLIFKTSNTERMRIDSSGNVGIGVVPEDWDPVFDVLRIGKTGLLFSYDTAGDGMWLGSNAFYDDTLNDYKYISTDPASLYTQFNGTHSWSYAASGTANTQLTFSEAMRIDSSGNLNVGRTSAGAVNQNGVTVYNTGEIYSFIEGTSSIASMRFYRNTSGTPVVVGSISTNGTTTAYNTSSDQRLKENIADADDAGAKIDSIQVRKFDWKADGSHQDYGMVAQELQAVAPEAVSGDPDSDEMMGVDYSKLVPMMLKEIQSLRARIAALES
jgi:hypothetical protein